MKKYYDEFTNYQAMTSSGIEIHLYLDHDLDRVESHLHDFFEVYYLVEGKVQLLIGDQLLTLTQNTIVLIPPGTKHSESILSEKYERLILWLNPWYLTRLSSRKTSLSSCFVSIHSKGYIISSEQFIHNRIVMKLYEILRETHEREFGSDIMKDALVQELLIMFNRSEHHNLSNENESIQEVISYVNQHFTEKLSLDFLCEKFFVSKFHLSRNFEKLTKKSFYNYLLDKRMLLAKQLLLSGSRPTEVSVICGFNQYSNFYRIFLKKYGSSPSQFIKKNNIF